MLLSRSKVGCGSSSVGVRWEIAHLTRWINLVNMSKILSWLWSNMLHIVAYCANLDIGERIHLISIRSKQSLSVRFVTLSIFSWIKPVSLLKSKLAYSLLSWHTKCALTARYWGVHTSTSLWLPRTYHARWVNSVHKIILLRQKSIAKEHPWLKIRASTRVKPDGTGSILLILLDIGRLWP